MRKVWRWVKKRWDRLMWVRVGYEVGGMAYTVSVHRFGLRSVRVAVVCVVKGRQAQKAPAKKVWRLN